MDSKLILPLAALGISLSGCVAYEQPAYYRSPTYVAPATTTYVTEPAYVAPVTYSTTTYYSEPRYISTGGYRHHEVGRLPLHGRYGSGPRHSTHGPHDNPHNPPPTHAGAFAAQKAAIHNTQSMQKVAIHNAQSMQKAAIHNAQSMQKAAMRNAQSSQKAAARAIKRR